MGVWSLVLVAATFTVLGVAAPRSGVQPDGPRCAIADLPGLDAQWRRAHRDASTGRGGDGAPLDAGRASDLSRVAHAVLGSGGGLLDDAVAATADGVGASPSAVPCGPFERARDAQAWRLTLAGFSAREIADVLGGHLAVDDVIQARVRLMAGQPASMVAAFLEARWDAARVAAVAPAPEPATARRPGLAGLGALEADLDALSRDHGVAPALVRAVIAAESGGDPRAVSRAGAIGLMQLMPATARALGVDPWQPRQNLRGGITYLGTLLRSFADTRLALIAYNAGPQHARAVQAGRAVAYRETRAYLDAIDARLRSAGR